MNEILTRDFYLKKIKLFFFFFFGKISKTPWGEKIKLTCLLKKGYRNFKRGKKVGGIECSPVSKIRMHLKSLTSLKNKGVCFDRHLQIKKKWIVPNYLQQTCFRRLQGIESKYLTAVVIQLRMANSFHK